MPWQLRGGARQVITMLVSMFHNDALLVASKSL